MEDTMAHGNNTLLNHYLAGDDFEDIAKICGITIEQVREYMSMKTSEDVRLNQRDDRTLYGRRLIARLERGLADGPWGEG